MSEIKETKETKKQPKKIVIQPMHGPMHHLTRDYRIDGLTQVPEIDDWLQAQIDAGKITVL